MGIRERNAAFRRLHVLRDTIKHDPDALRLEASTTDLAPTPPPMDSFEMNPKVTVYAGDMFQVLRFLVSSSKFDRPIFAVLNPANRYQPGGGYAHGCPALEEMMRFATTAHVDDAAETGQDPAVVPVRGYDRPLGEQCIIPETPRVLFKSPEVRYPDGEIIAEASFERTPAVAFREMRSCAVDLRGVLPHEFDMARYIRTTTRRINNQFEAAQNAGVRHVLLTAIGCGAFIPPTLTLWGSTTVAMLYRNATRVWAKRFDTIAFAILPNPGYGADNYTIWHNTLTLSA
jgi:hypothetical protein